MRTERLTFEVDIERGGDARVVSVNGKVLPKFLPVDDRHYVRVSDVTEVMVLDEDIGGWEDEPGEFQPHIIVSRASDRSDVSIGPPYFAAWLDRLGIPWTDDLRKAHEAATKEDR